MKTNNHLYPFFHINKWKNNNGKIFVKNCEEIKNIPKRNSNRTFAERYYYSLGEKNDILENRISSFECVIAPIISKIDDSNEFVQLTGKELELLKLYIYLCVSRHEYTCEVIKEDESNIYRSNNYIYGTHREKTQKDAVEITNKIMDEFDKLIKAPDNISTQIDWTFCDFSTPFFTFGLHVVIMRADGNKLLISNRISIIENTMDSDHLYSYVPISPKTAILLVKTKYFFDIETYFNSRHRLSLKHGGNGDDPYLSVIFGKHNYLREVGLFCSYGKVKLIPSLKEEYITLQKTKYPKIRIVNMNAQEIVDLNSIYYDDGEEILFCDENELNKAKNNDVSFRVVELCGSGGEQNG